MKYLKGCTVLKYFGCQQKKCRGRAKPSDKRCCHRAFILAAAYFPNMNKNKRQCQAILWFYDIDICDTEKKKKRWDSKYKQCNNHSTTQNAVNKITDWLATTNGMFKQLFLHSDFALTNLHNTRTIGVCEAFRTLAWVEVIIQPWQTDATISAWVGVTQVSCGLKEEKILVWNSAKFIR